MCFPPAEHELLYRLKQGEMEAFNRLYHLYFHPVYLNALKVTRDISIAEDIVQEVFVALWEKRETIHPEKSVGGWLFVTCYNKSVNVLRKKLKKQYLPEMVTDSENEFSDTLQDTVESKWQLLEQGIAQLSPQKRKVFELCKIQGKSYEETAVQLQISKNTVKEYLASAMSFLRTYVYTHSQSVLPSSASLVFWMLL